MLFAAGLKLPNVRSRRDAAWQLVVADRRHRRTTPWMMFSMPGDPDRPGVAKRADDRFPTVVDDRGGQGFLGIEVVVESALGHFGALDDVAQAGCRITDLVDQVDGRVDDLLPRRLGSSLAHHVLELLRRSVQAVSVGRDHSSFASDWAASRRECRPAVWKTPVKSSVRVGPGSRSPRGPEVNPMICSAR